MGTQKNTDDEYQYSLEIARSFSDGINKINTPFVGSCGLLLLLLPHHPPLFNDEKHVPKRRRHFPGNTTQRFFIFFSYVI